MIHLPYDNIRTDCYVAIIEKMRARNPDAMFVTITRTARSELAPSWDLLRKYMVCAMPFESYIDELRKELLHRDDAREKIHELALLARSGKTIFLVCYEKDASKCHRSLVKQLVIDELKRIDGT